MSKDMELNSSLKPVLSSTTSFQRKKRSNTLSSISSNNKAKKTVTFSEYDTVITPKLITINSNEGQLSDEYSSDYGSEEGESEHYELTESGKVVLIIKKNNQASNTSGDRTRRFSIGSIKDSLFNRRKQNKHGKHQHKCSSKNNKKKTFSFKNVIFNIDYKMTDPNSLVRLNKTWKVFPFHLFPILKYSFINTDYDLVKSLLVLIPCQIVYLLLQVIPNTNYGYIATDHNSSFKSSVRGHRNSHSIKRKKKNKTMKANIVILLECIIVLPIVSFLLSFFIIICGGPMGSFKETFYLACHINAISLPMGYTLINCNFKQVNLKKYYIIVLLGSWLGCFVIPLDWDRDWQRWPISLVVGAYIGGIIAYGIGIYI